ncbi:helix-turn-helix domain-containing protein [Kineothrix sedimenti]|uniref:Helix-turn-helix domain-containing protein n=1 Tax=Kineothrix sedimenti TaxID=3123317 RepID=A0ABZ3ETD2_9FIRM
MGDISTLFTTTGITDSKRILHTPGEFAKRNLLYVQEVGKLKSLQPHKSQREKLDSFLFLGVLSGAGTITIGNVEFKVKKGYCALINCMDYYAHESSKKMPWELMWVHFNGNTAKEYFDLFMEQNQQKNIFAPEGLVELEGYINRLMEYQKEKDLESELLSGNILGQLINTCLFTVIHHEKENQQKYKEICNEIRECVNEKYQEPELLHIFTGRYGIDEEELDICFQKTYGITLRDYIVNRRFTAAKELLRFTVKPIKEIIEESGIGNDDLFRKLFQDGEKMTAEEYRMKWSQWVK